MELVEDWLEIYLCKVLCHYDETLVRKRAVHFEVMLPELLDEPIK